MTSDNTCARSWGHYYLRAYDRRMISRSDKAFHVEGCQKFMRITATGLNEIEQKHVESGI